MERERRTQGGEGGEEMYFEMDFSPSADNFHCHDDFDDSKSLSEMQVNKPVTPNLDQVLRSGSSSIPIHACTQASPPTSIPSNSSTWSERRTLSPQCLISRSVTDTPVSSVSPSSSFIPRILRESFSKLLHRGSVTGRAKTPDREHGGSDPECYNSEDRRDSECSIASPATKEIVNESLRNGLPIIPFAHPTFATASKYQEEVKKRIRKNSLKKSMKRSFSEGRCLDFYEVLEEDDETRITKFNSEDKSLDSIVRMAKQEIERVKQGKPSQDRSRNQSQSSYVEMNPADDLSTELIRTTTSAQDPYMRMEEFLENSYHQMERKPEDDPIFHLEHNQTQRSKQSHLFPMPHDLLSKKPPKRKNNLLEAGKGTAELLQESLGRRFKKGNKHKNDYVFFDFEQNKDYVDMQGKAKTKKWHFLDFNDKK